MVGPSCGRPHAIARHVAPATLRCADVGTLCDSGPARRRGPSADSFQVRPPLLSNLDSSTRTHRVSAVASPARTSVEDTEGQHGKIAPAIASCGLSDSHRLRFSHGPRFASCGCLRWRPVLRTVSLAA